MQHKRRDRLVGLFVAGVVLLNPPVLDLFSGGWVLGIPSLYVYFFAVWALLIAGLAFVLERRPARDEDREDGPR
jgi:hypothetical protein